MLFQRMSLGGVAFLVWGLWIWNLSSASAFVPHFTQSSTMQGRYLLMSSATMEYNNRKTSFEDRMKNMVFRSPSSEQASIHKETSKLPHNIQIAKTLEDYKEIVGGETDRIVVVRFFAPWCKACKAIRPLFYRLAHEYPNVLFVDVPVTESNANLHQGLGIPSIPFGHIYTPDGGLVEELKITRPHFPQLARKLRTYIVGSCDLVDGETSSPFECCSQ